MSESLIKSKLESAKFRDIHNENEWTPQLDEELKRSVVVNYFNFNIVSLDINDEAQRIGLKFGAANAYTNEKCRIRWFFLHCQRSLINKGREKQQRLEERKEYNNNKENVSNELKIKSEAKVLNPSSKIDREFKEDNNIKNQSSNAKVVSSLKFKSVRIEPRKLTEAEKEAQKIVLPEEIPVRLKDDSEEEKEKPKSTDTVKKLWEKKEIREDLKQSKTYTEAEKYYWRQNIRPDRRNIDFLDTSNENFLLNKTVDVQGNEINPSTFNIFRDSIKKTSTEIKDVIQQSIPDLKLDETSESDENEEVVPLDFRTKLINGSNNIVMQAKPLKLYDSNDEVDDGLTLNELLKTTQADYERKYLTMSSEDIMKQVKKESFKDDEEDVILIQPNLNIQEKLSTIDLECNRNEFLNNTLTAPKIKSKAPKVNKVFKQEEDDNSNLKKLSQVSKRKKKVTINETPIEGKMSYAPDIPDEPIEGPNNDLLDFDKILEDQGLNVNEMLGDIQPESKQAPTIFNSNTIMQLLANNSITEVSMDDIANLIADPSSTPVVDEHSTSENEMAPLSAIVDESAAQTSTTNNLKNSDRKQLAFHKSLVEASSASEDERGLNKRNTYLSSDEEMIYTTKEAIQRANNIENEANQFSVLKNSRIKSTTTPYPSNSVVSSGTSNSNTKSTLSNTGLVLQVPGLHTPSQTNIAVESVHKVDEKLKPDSLLFKKLDPVERQREEKEQVMHSYNNRPRTAVERAPQKINYRGFMIQADTKSGDEANSDDEKHYFNYQREIQKKKLKEQNNSDFGDVDKIRMENVGVEIVNNSKHVKVERDWGTSMTNFDTYIGKSYTEDNE